VGDGELARHVREAAEGDAVDSFTLRTARAGDVPALRALIERSARALSVGFYSPAQIESAIRHVFGVDTNLVADGTYFVVSQGAAIVGCGGWSRRRRLYGGDQRPVGSAEWLNPEADAAKIRAFFVAPEHARRGVGRLLLEASTAAARAAGFSRFELMATLPGVPLYEACGFVRTRDVMDILPDGVSLPLVQMERRI
jgi:GNAT superfamily N-acetyltransferase